MPQKTYIPQAVNEAQAMSRYFGRWAAKMQVGATDAQKTALANLIACIAQFLVEWHKPPINP